MIAKAFVSAVAAAAVVSAQGNSNFCSQDTIQINSNADASNLQSCRTVKSINIGNQTDNSLKLSGPTTIEGDLTVQGNKNLRSLESDTIQTIKGKFTLASLEKLDTLKFDRLGEVGEIAWQTLPQLAGLGFGTVGVTKAKKVIISDTFLNSLDGLNLVTVDFMDLNNNGRLLKHVSKLANLTTLLKLQANGRNELQWEMPELLWAANLTIANVSTFTVPKVKEINGSLRFDTNKIVSFDAPNLTKAGADISFVGNAALSNISFPQLTTVGGSLTIANNTALERLDTMPKLQQVGGAVRLRGNFSAVELPSMDSASGAFVKGVFDVQSTTDIKKSCNSLKAHARTQDGGDNKIQGPFTCESNNDKANEDINNPNSGGSKNPNSATGMTINMALLGLSLVAGVASML
ncbi:hypothetical protein GGTG_02720 [Gaeumannomyces tritici R3-111a-1]|uniref:Uncharacterized protein n=1 Tax=Gaeumannomyces tritici (strain R3-111a-1) TaxID=644352 RepID=J3NN62_GAET3|nr:hypothetical protein GGTG_02720 [Gaeumannomyces tritici R3-111a-1]EJT77614.1 hypothetical protein GGTG_02720 [Gaeumannomyces tritici R3-111a-1]